MYLQAVAREGYHLFLEPEKRGEEVCIKIVSASPDTERSSRARQVTPSYLSEIVEKAQSEGEAEVDIFDPPFRATLFTSRGPMRLRIKTNFHSVIVPISNLQQWYHDFLRDHPITIYFTEQHCSSLFGEDGVLYVGTFVHQEHCVRQDDLLHIARQVAHNVTRMSSRNSDYWVEYAYGRLEVVYRYATLSVKGEALEMLLSWTKNNISQHS